MIQYALGVWGAEATDIMEPNVKHRILNRGRAREWTAWTPPQPSLIEIRNKFGGPALSDEELLLRVYAGSDNVDALMSAGAPKPNLDGRRPLLQLIEDLAKKKDTSHIYIRRDGVSLTLGKSPKTEASS